MAWNQALYQHFRHLELSAVQCLCRCTRYLMCHSRPFSCRKTMVVHWSARNMSAKSSSAWAFKGRNAPHRSPHFLLTLLSTLSGYTKCSNFTPVWRATDDVVRKPAPCLTWPQPEKGDRSSMNQTGRNEEKHLMERGRSGILCLNLSFYREDIV